MKAGHSTVLVVGHTVLDHRFWVETFPPEGGRTPATSYRVDMGGPGAVASTAIQALQGHARLISRVGADEAGNQVLGRLKDAGIDTSLVQVIASARTAVSTVIIGPDGNRYIFPYAGENLPSTCSTFREEDLDGAEAVLVDSRWPLCALRYATAARARGLPVVVDLDVDQDDMWAVAREASHVICDEDLAATLGGPSALLAQLGEQKVWGAVTLGDRGVATQAGVLPAFQVPVKDSTGAGDVFHGAFALRIAESGDNADALRFAAAAGAEKCRLGHVPSRAEVSLRLDYGNG